MPKINYPAFYWKHNYVQIAEERINLCATPRSVWKEDQARSKPERYYLLDSTGWYYEIIDWVRVPRFGGITGLALSLIGSVFAEPVLSNGRQLPLPEYKMKIAKAMKSRYQYDLDRDPAFDTVGKLQSAQTYAEALRALPKIL